MNDRPEPKDSSDPAATDSVLEQRARMHHLATLGQRVGYSLFGVAVVLFFVGFPAGFPSWLITTIIVCLAVGSVVLAPAIVIGYGVKAADREDRETGHTV